MMASVATVPGWVNICGNAAPVLSVGVFLAPIPTIRQVSEDKSVGNLPLLPYSSMIANCFLWCTYGILKSESKIWSPNGIGLSLAFYYFTQFIKHSPKSSKTLPGSVKQHVQACLSVIGFTSLLALFYPKPSNAAIIGTTGVVFCVGMFASPLAALQAVIRTKSAQSIPLPFTIATVLNCFCWSAIGWFDMNDVNVYLPNLLGLFFGVVQVLLKLIYGDGKSGMAELPL